jgi:hypothetical protein
MLEQVRARLFTRRTLVGWLSLAGFATWQVINGWSNLEFIVGKAPKLRDALLAVLDGAGAFVASQWFPWLLLIGGLLWIAVGASSSGLAAGRFTSIPVPPVLLPRGERVFVNEDLAYLSSLYRGQTTAQADKLAEIYRGKWMKITGQVDDVTSRAMSFAHQRDVPLVIIHFRDDWQTRFELLKRGDKATVIAKIDEISANHISLVSGELVDSVQGHPTP